MTKYCYSHDGEEYHGPYDSAAEALAKGGEGVTHIAEVAPAENMIEGLDLAEVVLEHLDCNLHDTMGGDDEIITLEPNDAKELDRIIVAFLKEKAHFQRWGVGNVQVVAEMPTDD